MRGKKRTENNKKNTLLIFSDRLQGIWHPLKKKEQDVIKEQ